MKNQAHSKDERSKLLGQYFTPKHVAKFALLGLRNTPSVVLDPMVGEGVFLEVCADLFPKAGLVGIELDPKVAEKCRALLGRRASIETADVFTWVRRRAIAGETLFSAVVGNPPYVSYQNLGRIRTVIADVGDGTLHYAKYLTDTIREVAAMRGLSRQVELLLREWSGLSDLSAYAIVLAWLLTTQTGEIALVTSNHWMEREYGRALRRFLARSGTIRGVVRHKRGDWFPSAQVPTSVFVFEKGEPSRRQEESGIPFVELEGPAAPDLSDLLNSRTGNEFWRWLDGLNEPYHSEELKVSFRRWTSTASGERQVFGGASATEELSIPKCLEKEQIAFTLTGWEVHQGIRTGSNEAFYLQATGKGTNRFVSTVTKRGLTDRLEVMVPHELLVPTIRYLRKDSPLMVTDDSSPWFLLNLSNVLLPEDVSAISRYPLEWRRAWKLENPKVIPDDLADRIRELASTPYEGKGTVRLTIPNLSAVKTNVYTPPFDSVSIPPKPRFWYQLRFQPRHYGELIIPRVTSGAERTILIEKPGSLCVDANFTTMIHSGTAIGVKRMWAWFNSNAFRIMCEKNGSPLGGGALKVEATLIEKLPLPKRLADIDEGDLSAPIGLPTRPINDEELLTIGYELDSCLFGEEVAKQNLAEVKAQISLRLGRPRLN